jgi:outer membrane protein OmpA-like peptidoglycan-associated protein
MPEAERRIDMRIRSLLLASISLTIFLGCSVHDRAVLFPDHLGAPGSLLVQSERGETILDRPYNAADVYPDGRVETKMLDADAVHRQFKDALSAQPQRPMSYTLYFITEKDELTPESKLVMGQMKTELLRRAFPEITVIGHTDSAGSVAYNDALSLKRAETMRRILVEAGIPSELIKSAGRGSREMLVKTEEGVSEPRNRRVEISIR